MPSPIRRVNVGVWTSPPSVSGRPKPTSSRRTMRMFGASGGRWFGSARRTCFDSCNVGPAVLAVGTGGNGRTDPSASLTCWANATVVALPTTTAAAMPAPTPFMSLTSRRLVIPFLIMRLHLQQFQLNAFDRLADVRAQPNLTDRELLERGKVLLDDRQQRRQAPRLVLVHLPVQVARL